MIFTFILFLNIFVLSLSNNKYVNKKTETFDIKNIKDYIENDVEISNLVISDYEIYNFEISDVEIIEIGIYNYNEDGFEKPGVDKIEIFDIKMIELNTDFQNHCEILKKNKC